MRSPIVTVTTLLLSVSLASAEPWVFKESPLDGVVEFKEELESGTAYRHFVNAIHIISASMKSPGSKSYASIEITTSAIEPVSHGETSTSVKHHLSFETEEKAERVLSKILAEMSHAHRNGGLSADNPGEKEAADKEAPTQKRLVEPDELQTARVSFQDTKRRYLRKHPSYLYALGKVQELEKGELQAARASFEAIKRRYKSKHPRYMQALRKVQELEKRVQK